MKNLNVLLIGLMLASCSKIEKFEKQTNSMENNTKSLAGKTDSMKRTTTAMYEQFRSKESQETRQRNLDHLRSAKGMGEKLVAASVYFKSFEFQLWTNMESIDDEMIRDLMFKDAANEITKIICDLMDEVNLKRMSPTKENNDEMNVYALAATVHMNHTYQDLLKEKQNVEEISMYDLIKGALIKSHNKEKSIEDHLKPFLNGPTKEVMTDFLKTRVDMISALALRNLTDKRKMDILQKAKGGLFKVTGGFFGSIDVPEIYDPSDYITNEFTISYLNAAVNTRQLLQELRDGQEIKLEKTVRSAFENIDLKTSEDKNGTGVTVVDDTKEHIKFLINGLL